MTEFFGLSMTYLALGCVIVTALIFAVVGWIALRNPVMFKLGLRNIPRRRAQAALIVFGLMLSTLIVTAAFGVGDTMNESIKGTVYNVLDEGDEVITWNEQDNPANQDDQVLPLTEVERIKQALADNTDIEGFLALRREVLPFVNPRTQLNEAQVSVAAFPQLAESPFALRRAGDGSPVVLSANEVAINEKLADELDARVGDRLLVFFGEQATEVAVAAIVEESIQAGSDEGARQAGAAISWELMEKITGQSGTADELWVTNVGGVRSGVERSDAVTKAIEEVLEGTPYEVDDAKASGIEFAELFASFFTTFFLIMGLFSIAAGVLLIFLIFIMLAAERKPEMGMARAVGAKRVHLVESFLAEGLAYDLGAAVIGVVAGIAVMFAMIAFVSNVAGDELVVDLQATITPRSLIVSSCLGIISTFTVITFASIRASRLNIIAAIRDLPESRPVNLEAATWLGYVRGALNGFVAFGFLVVGLLVLLRGASPILLPWVALAVLSGLTGLWLAMLRHSNFGAPANERKVGAGIPRWPWVLGLATVVVGGLGVLVLIGYGLALLVVRIARDRKPERMSAWLMLLGLVVPPFGVVLVALQSRRRAIPWAAGFGVFSAVAGATLVQWGLVENAQFSFMSGISLLFLWIAVTLRYFGIHERLTFTVTSAALLVIWFLGPAGLLEPITGELNGDFEMFFLSGIGMISAGTFLLVYNADIVLPLVGAVGARFGRIMPAMRMAVAYPLTSRFRTGMTVAMIGLITFALVAFSTINTNFANIFLSDDADGGFDVRVSVNTNNQIGDLRAALAGNGGRNMSSAIEEVAQVRVATSQEAEVLDPGYRPGRDDPEDEYQAFPIVGPDDSFLRSAPFELQSRAKGYATDAAVWEAVASGERFAIAPAFLFNNEGEGGGDGAELVIDGEPGANFEPFPLVLRDPASATPVPVTVIGQMKGPGEIFFGGLIVRRDLLLAVYPDASGQEFYLKLKPGTDAEVFAKQVEAALVQASADSLQKLLDDQRSLQQSFLLLFQGFMGLGLLVGISSLGVIAFRAVVERRQEIGMLRAIGYQKGMVALSFGMETAFVALSGIVLGLVLALGLSWVLFTQGGIDESTKDAGFVVPWIHLAIICGTAFGASLLMAVLPARAASRVPVAEALRYE